MSDVVDDLREWRDAGNIRRSLRDLCGEAIVEIERLRAVLSQYGRHTSDCDYSDDRGWKPCSCGWHIASGLTPAGTPQSPR